MHRTAGRSHEGGFTLVEVLVVTVLLAVLVMIAIPVYLAQRERAWDASTQSDLRNAAVALETYFTSHGSYEIDAVASTAYGFSRSPDVTLDTDGIVGVSYCLSGRYDGRGNWFAIESDGSGVAGPSDVNPC